MKLFTGVLAAAAVVAGLCSAAPQSRTEETLGEHCVPISVKIGVGPDGSCTVRDFHVRGVRFQEEFYPWTNVEGSLFNCEAVGPWTRLEHSILWPDGLDMPTSLSGVIMEGTLGDVAVEGEIFCAGHQNTFSQPFLGMGLPFLRLQNVSVAAFNVPQELRPRGAVVYVAFTGAGIMHIEDPETFHIGASTAGAVLGLVIEHGKYRVRNKADGHLQVQGHIFEPEDPMPGMLTGHVCDERLALLVGWGPVNEDRPAK